MRAGENDLATITAVGVHSQDTRVLFDYWAFVALTSTILVTDPVLRARTAGGTSYVGLHAILAAAHDGTLLDLPGVRPDQRAPVVTALAIISHLLRRYAPEPLVGLDHWRFAFALSSATMPSSSLTARPRSHSSCSRCSPGSEHCSRSRSPRSIICFRRQRTR